MVSWPLWSPHCRRPCHATNFNMREQCSLMLLHGQSQTCGFLFNEERHLNIQAAGQNMMEGEKERRKKKDKTGFNQVLSQSKLD